jgi:hypothetical protein
MIENKPQFDLNIVQPGNAYWLKKKGTYNIDGPAIVTDINRLSIELIYYNISRKQMDEVTLDINDVVKEIYVLTPMLKEQEVINVSFKKFNEAIPRGSKEDKEGF